MNGKTQFNLWYWVAAFIGLMVFQTIFSTATQVAQIPYSEFETHLEAGRIAPVKRPVGWKSQSSFSASMKA